MCGNQQPEWVLNQECRYTNRRRVADPTILILEVQELVVLRIVNMLIFSLKYTEPLRQLQSSVRALWIDQVLEIGLALTIEETRLGLMHQLTDQTHGIEFQRLTTTLEMQVKTVMVLRSTIDFMENLPELKLNEVAVVFVILQDLEPSKKSLK